jgi:thioredoxin reductase (NADPH)
MSYYPVVIIGAGPAGLAAALQLKRSGFNPLVLEKGLTGGLLLNAYRIENYLGFSDVLSGQGLVSHFERQMKRWDIRISRQTVIKLSSDKGAFRIVTQHGVINAHSVIIASGTRSYAVGIKGESDLIKQKRLYYEIKQMPPLKTQHAVTVLGGGDAAFDYALNLAGRVRLVNIILRGKQPKCLPLLAQRVKINKKIKLFIDTQLLSAEETPDKKYLLLTVKKGNKVSFIKTNYLLAAIGREPELSYWTGTSEQLDVNAGLFLAGDVKRGMYRQASIAIGDGILAAMQVLDYLKTKIG